MVVMQISHGPVEYPAQLEKTYGHESYSLQASRLFSSQNYSWHSAGLSDKGIKAKLLKIPSWSCSICEETEILQIDDQLCSNSVVILQIQHLWYSTLFFMPLLRRGYGGQGAPPSPVVDGGLSGQVQRHCIQVPDSGTISEHGDCTGKQVEVNDRHNHIEWQGSLREMDNCYFYFIRSNLPHNTQYGTLHLPVTQLRTWVLV